MNLYTSLPYIKNWLFAFYHVKIDPSYLPHLNERPIMSNIVNPLTSVAYFRMLGIKNREKSLFPSTISIDTKGP